MPAYTRRSTRIAFCGVLSALSVVFMIVSGLIPLATYISPMIAGVLLLPVFLEFGAKSAWTMWLATALVTLIIGSDKEAAFFYVFLGYYPLVKPRLDRISAPILRAGAKILFFLLAGSAMYGFLIYILKLDAVLAEFEEATFILNAAFFMLLTFCMMVYDKLLLRLLVIYARVLRPKFKFLRR